MKNIADSTGLGVSQLNRKIIQRNFSLKAGNHQVGDVLLKHRVGVS
ncbi:MAG: hypothetical protein LBK82_13160 [Planctomycetaceae bacterium]|jgi:hypothetical protein|nr:hypothetical protein [Planctomycetaceae bacterium]